MTKTVNESLIENLDLNVSNSIANEFPTSFNIKIDKKQFDFILLKSNHYDNIFKIDSDKQIKKIENLPKTVIFYSI